jgi:hypothetical protein
VPGVQISMALTSASCVFNTLLPIFMVTELKMTMKSMGMFEGGWGRAAAAGFPAETLNPMRGLWGRGRCALWTHPWCGRTMKRMGMFEGGWGGRRQQGFRRKP